MNRVLLQYLLPLVLPALLYVAWWWGFGRRRTAADGRPARLTEGPWVWLFIGGVGLMAGALTYTALTGSEAPGGQYVPPHLEDGRVVPGRVERD